MLFFLCIDMVIGRFTRWSHIFFRNIVPYHAQWSGVAQATPNRRVCGVTLQVELCVLARSHVICAVSRNVGSRFELSRGSRFRSHVDPQGSCSAVAHRQQGPRLPQKQHEGHLAQTLQPRQPQAQRVGSDSLVTSVPSLLTSLSFLS